MKTIKDLITINQCSNQQYQLFIKGVDIWVKAPKDNEEIRKVLCELGLEVEENDNEEITRLYDLNEAIFDNYYIQSRVGIEGIIDKLIEKIKE